MRGASLKGGHTQQQHGTSRQGAMRWRAERAAVVGCMACSIGGSTAIVGRNASPRQRRFWGVV
jgi:hypothetical protein